MTYRGFLAELLMAECDDRARRFERQIKAAEFTKTIARYGRADLLCVDLCRLHGLDRRGAELLFQILTVDRLLHHAHLVLTQGDLHRLAEALAGKGVIPLTT